MAANANLTLRQLEKGDADKGFLSLLAQLTVVGEISKSQFEERLQLLQAKQPDYYIVVLEDLDKQKIVASATLLIEYKILRHCGKVGHIEDVVVDDGYRGQKLGQRVIAALVSYAQRQGCYKVILDCSDSNVSFYEKCGFTRKEVQMALYMTPNEAK
ncbi:hypothetical protein ABBQ38_010072 [Trebouxia sp. C0009 RCD-2024]